jgi:hypothetical protein
VPFDGADGAPPYVVRWRDGHETAFFPASGTEVTHHPAAPALLDAEVSSVVRGLAITGSPKRITAEGWGTGWLRSHCSE